MRAKRLAPTIFVCLAALALRPSPSSTAFAQAWVPAEGEGSVTTTYQNLQVHDHFNGAGVASSAIGSIRTNAVITSIEYGITDRLTLDAEVAYIASKYKGAHPHGPPDTGRYHPTFQDAYIGVRYNVLESPVVLTPFVGVTIPTHNYDPRGHSGVGRHFNELLFGVTAARGLDPVLKNVYVQASYSFALLKHFDGLNLNRSNLDWEVGWDAHRRLSVSFLGALQVTHGGLITPLDEHIEDHLREFHDRATRAQYVRLGGGATLSVSRACDLHAAYLTTVSGRNTHAPRGFAVGISWRFSRGLDISKISAGSSPRGAPAAGQGAF